MIRTIFAAFALTLAFTAEAAAQGWSHEGIAIPQRDGWCTKTTEQDDGAGGKIGALEVRPCNQDMPYMSIGVAARGVDKLDMEALAAQTADAALQDVGKSAIDAIIAKTETDCIRMEYTVTLDVVEGANGYDIFADYECPDAGPTTLRTYTAYAQRANGDVWVIAFDHPRTDVTDEDAAMLRNAIAAIKAS